MVLERSLLLALALLCATSAQAEDPRRRCERDKPVLLEKDGRYRCLGIPLEATFPPGFSVTRAEGYVDAQACCRPGDAVEATRKDARLLFVRKVVSEDRSSSAADELRAFAERMLGREAIVGMNQLAVPGAEAAFAVQCELPQKSGKWFGEARAIRVRGFNALLMSAGTPESGFASGGANAKTFLDSFRVVPQTTPSIVLALPEQLEVELPPETLQLGEDRTYFNWIFFTATVPATFRIDRMEDSGTGPCEPLLANAVAPFNKNPEAKVQELKLRSGPASSVEFPQSVLLFACAKDKLFRFDVLAPLPAKGSRELLTSLAEAIRPATPPSELRIAMTGSYWPLHAEHGDQRTGFEAELARAIADELKLKPLFLGKQELGTTSLEAVANGAVDVAISAITPTDERRRTVDFTRPYIGVPYRLLRPIGAAEITSLAQLSGKKIAVPKGPAMTDLQAILAGAKAKLTQVGSVDEGIKLLRKKKVQLIAGESPGLMEYANDGELTGPVLATSGIAIAVKKGDAARFDAVLDRMGNLIDQLKVRYGVGEPAQAITLGNVAGEGDSFTASVKLVAGKLKLELGGTDPEPTPMVIDAETGLPFRSEDYQDSTEALAVSVPVRMQPIARAAPAYKQARALFFKELNVIAHDGQYLDSDSIQPPELAAAPRWFVLANGVLVTATPWSVDRECTDLTEEERAQNRETPGDQIPGKTWSCPIGGWLVVAAQGKDVQWKSVTTRGAESTPP